ncbi:Rtf2 RING-finger-domain-containing protein [Syncephalis pseudoplumigaleata]|uniref:Rtf2 RING-finger-domain-containing protein n=1 Tax=Syncephalis pseudoplumigaleata TaxID=1712513 RepID=A0A4P9Z2F3_9FUNG|nr:Rtf2 RING-finger-domain-containing protein [Syncephalis pseudoplumigaleata]|eukprot:RKP26545.1 Rtf2 RING-finger-domain-containing protein [Syncephalis pseudoplumigaleata]
MGNDGGSIPKRSELVKEKKKDPVADARIQTIARWFYCALSKTLLQVPVVADLLGTLYNREAILEMLLDRSRYGDADVICPHIHSLKDVVTLKLTPNSAAQYSHTNGTTLMGADESAPRALFVCPITKREMNGRYRFVFSRQCGCVVSEQAVREIEEAHCLVCNKPVAPDDYIPINPDAEQLVKLKAALESRKKAKVNDDGHINEHGC